MEKETCSNSLSGKKLNRKFLLAIPLIVIMSGVQDNVKAITNIEECYNSSISDAKCIEYNLENDENLTHTYLALKLLGKSDIEILSSLEGFNDLQLIAIQMLFEKKGVSWEEYINYIKSNDFLDIKSSTNTDINITDES